VLHYPDKAVIY